MSTIMSMKLNRFIVILIFLCHLDLDLEVNIYLCVLKGCTKYLASQINSLMMFLCNLLNCPPWGFVLTLHFPEAVKNKILLFSFIQLQDTQIILFLKDDLIL